MKKRLLIIISIILFSIIWITWIFTIISKAFKIINARTVTTDEFQKVVEKYDFTVQDIPFDESEYEHLKIAKVAINNKEGYEILYMETYDKNQARQLYTHNKEILNKEKKRVSTSLEFPSYAKYSLTNFKKYGIVINVDNILIYSLTDKTYKKEIKKIIKELGY